MGPSNVTVSAPAPGSDFLPQFQERVTTIVGIFFYVAGTIAFVGIAVAFFVFRMYELSNDSRIAFIVLFSGLFLSIQGLIFLLLSRNSEQRRTTNLMLRQMAALYGHSPRPAGGDDSSGAGG
ncbi:MAG: hypothetical protein JWM19_934 [Actinomycetia bacterium]|nr:hypothetical protein [Actinomycetes bacterium]